MSRTPQENKFNSGMTLMEILVVLGIITIIGSLSMVMGVDTYRRQIFRSDRDLLVTALQHARSQAVSNICLGSGCTGGKPHGVYVGPDSYIIFQGTSYATRDTDVDAEIDADQNIIQSGITEIVFEQLSGDASVNPATTPPWNILLTEVDRSSTITIGSEGQIFWTN